MIIRIILVCLALAVVVGIVIAGIRAANSKHANTTSENEGEVRPYGPVSDDLNPDSWKTPEYGTRE